MNLAIPKDVPGLRIVFIDDFVTPTPLSELLTEDDTELEVDEFDTETAAPAWLELEILKIKIYLEIEM